MNSHRGWYLVAVGVLALGITNSSVGYSARGFMDGIRTKKELLDAIKAADIRFSDYKMEDVRTIPEADGAIVAYRQTLVGTEQGKPVTWHIYTHSRWQRRGGKWLLTMFQDSMPKE